MSQSFHSSLSFKACLCFSASLFSFLSYIHQGHLFFLLMALIFFPLYFQDILASVGSAWVFCMSFSAICASDARFCKLNMAEKRPAIWLLWVSVESQASSAGTSKYQGRNWRRPFNLGRYGKIYPGVIVRALHIYHHFRDWQQVFLSTVKESMPRKS